MTDREIAHGDPAPKLESCDHPQRPPRRVCDICKTARYAFTACSNRCLQAHQEAAHASALPSDAATRAARAQAERNRRSANVWELYAPHRERVMELIAPESTGGRLCVLGAGKCDDLDLPRLTHRFAEVHLVDLDGEAMERARDRQPAQVRDSIVLHQGVDVSGLLSRLDPWGDAFPDDHALHQSVFSAAHAVVAELGGPYDATASTCVLSQLLFPFQNAWAASDETWHKLIAATTAVHVGILAHNTRPRGAVTLVFDVLSSDEAPELRALWNQSPDALDTAVAAGTKSGSMVLQPHPQDLLAQICGSGVAAPEPTPRLTGPWLWDTSTAVQLVYAINLRRP